MSYSNNDIPEGSLAIGLLRQESNRAIIVENDCSRINRNILDQVARTVLFQDGDDVFSLSGYVVPPYYINLDAFDPNRRSDRGGGWILCSKKYVNEDWVTSDLDFDTVAADGKYDRENTDVQSLIQWAAAGIVHYGIKNVRMFQPMTEMIGERVEITRLHPQFLQDLLKRYRKF